MTQLGLVKLKNELKAATQIFLRVSLKLFPPAMADKLVQTTN